VGASMNTPAFPLPLVVKSSWEADIGTTWELHCLSGVRKQFAYSWDEMRVVKRLPQIPPTNLAPQGMDGLGSVLALK